MKQPGFSRSQGNKPDQGAKPNETLPWEVWDGTELCPPPLHWLGMAQVLAQMENGVREKRERGDRKKKAEQRETKLRERQERDDEKGERRREGWGRGSRMGGGREEEMREEGE